jgi:hypothetical protein
MKTPPKTPAVSLEGDNSSAIPNHGKPSSFGKASRFATIVAVACLVVGASFVFKASDTTVSNTKEDINISGRRKLSPMERLLKSEPAGDDATKEDGLVRKIAEKLKPVDLLFNEKIDEPAEEVEGEVEKVTVKKKKDVSKPSLAAHQFLHLHHMKTGGTSIDHLLRCAMNRLRRESKYIVNYYSIHECSRKNFAKCLVDPTNSCREKMNAAAVMSYCSALKYLDEFGWWHNNNEDNQVKAFTVLRNPVDRVWSMFRFQTKNCYKCMPLKEIYQKLEKGEDTGLDQLCLNQIQNHEVNNLLSTEFELDVTELDLENNDGHLQLRDNMVQEAINNMKGFFTVVGITEELVETSTILGKVFPWMGLDGREEDGTTKQCALEHANASPSNNRCGEGNTHWDLPKQPDQETMDLIVKYNSMDMELYEAAVAYFDLQQKALALNAKDNKP